MSTIIVKIGVSDLEIFLVMQDDSSIREFFVQGTTFSFCGTICFSVSSGMIFGAFLAIFIVTHLGERPI